MILPIERKERKMMAKSRRQITSAMKVSIYRACIQKRALFEKIKKGEKGKTHAFIHENTNRVNSLGNHKDTYKKF